MEILHFDGDNVGGRHQNGEITAFRRGETAHTAVAVKQRCALDFDRFRFFVIGHQRQDGVDALGMKVDIEFLMERIGAEPCAGSVFQ